MDTITPIHCDFLRPRELRHLNVIHLAVIASFSINLLHLCDITKLSGFTKSHSHRSYANKQTNKQTCRTRSENKSPFVNWEELDELARACVCVRARVRCMVCLCVCGVCVRACGRLEFSENKRCRVGRQTPKKDDVRITEF